MKEVAISILKAHAKDYGIKALELAGEYLIKAAQELSKAKKTASIEHKDL